ncbi:uncharacterized protein LOC111004780 [Momordica charantia]|uniref:Uncharacterized protein LOC111004780 n=1 Tax=Momordica charantia TaxID=3673 RepID=A0A6J1BU14_MOMCH|nr:uncharacterized protein LOC111004780 [Momordica charantia]
MAPDRLDLQRMEKKSTESFKEYAQRCRDTATQVQPPLTDKELSAMFINTLKHPFYDRMIGSASTNFSNIMTIGETIEYGVKHGQITSTTEELLAAKRQVIPRRKLAPVPVDLIQPPYPRWYDVNARCDYHAGAIGHSTKNCTALKYRVQALIRVGIESKSKVGDITIPLEELFENLLGSGYVSVEYLCPNLKYKEYDGSQTCPFHAGAKGHSLEQCNRFQKRVQELLDSKVLTVTKSQLKKRTNVVEDILVAEGSSDSLKPKPLTIFYCEKLDAPSCSRKPITITVPAAFEVRGLTRTERCYTPDSLLKRVNEPASEKNKEKASEKKEKAEEDKKGKTKLNKDICDELVEAIVVKDASPKQSVSEEETQDFLKLVKQSEYKAFVSQDITVDNLSNVVGNITASSSITFTDEEIPPESTRHTKPLHISVKCKNFLIAKVLVDNGSSLNIMPRSTLEKLPVDMSHMRPSTVIVRAFDGACSTVVRDIEILIQIGPCTFDITFQVMDITSAYSFLLGRPWIHSTGAVPSTLHQKIKFAVDQKLVIISELEDILVSRLASMPYVEAVEEAFESSFQSFEITDATTLHGKFGIPKPRLLEATFKGENGSLDKLLKMAKNTKKFGLRYKPSRGYIIRVRSLEKAKRLSRFENEERDYPRRIVPRLNHSFRSAGIIHQEYDESSAVAVVTEEREQVGPFV